MFRAREQSRRVFAGVGAWSVRASRELMWAWQQEGAGVGVGAELCVCAHLQGLVELLQPGLLLTSAAVRTRRRTAGHKTGYMMLPRPTR